MTEEPVLAKESISVFRNSVLEISGERISENMNSGRYTIENDTQLIIDSAIHISEIVINAIMNSLLLISGSDNSVFYTIKILISVKMNSVLLTILFFISLIYISTILNSEKYNSLFLIV